MDYLYHMLCVKYQECSWTVNVPFTYYKSSIIGGEYLSFLKSRIVMKWVNSTALKLLFASILLSLKLQSNKCLLYKLRMKGGMSERGLG